MKKQLALFYLCSTLTLSYAAPSQHYIVVEDPEALSAQIGIFDQTLTNYMAAFTQEELHALHDVLYSIWKGYNTGDFFASFRADMQEKGLWDTVVKLCRFLARDKYVKQHMKEVYSKALDAHCVDEQAMIGYLYTIRKYLKNSSIWKRYFRHRGVYTREALQRRMLQTPTVTHAAASTEEWRTRQENRERRYTNSIPLVYWITAAFTVSLGSTLVCHLIPSAPEPITDASVGFCIVLSLFLCATCCVHHTYDIDR